MVARPKRKQKAPKVDSCEASSSLIGPAFAMPDHAFEAEALGDEIPIDFQARQDSISATRRSAAPGLAPRLKRTSAKPSKAKETILKP